MSCRYVWSKDCHGQPLALAVLVLFASLFHFFCQGFCTDIPAFGFSSFYIAGGVIGTVLIGLIDDMFF